MKKAILITVGVILAALLGLGLLFYIGYAGVSTRPPTAQELTLMLSADEFAQYGFTNLNHALCESRTAKINLDGTIELEYEYDADLGPEADYLYISSDVNLEASEQEAREAMMLYVKAYQIGLKIGGAHAVEQPELFTRGDQHYSAVVFSGENPSGNILVVRKGRIIHSLILMGLYFDEPGFLDEHLSGVLERSDPDLFGSP